MGYNLRLMKKKITVFGAFDGLHDGHKAFLKEAKGYGDYLVAVVPSDDTVKQLKGRLPRLTLAERMQHLRIAGKVDVVIVGDFELGSWKVLEKHRPAVIALGFDQNLIKEELEKYFEGLDWKPEIMVLKKFKT